MAYEDRFIPLGPFNGGLNTYSQEGAIGDNEVVECMNLVPDIDGSLKCRPPLYEPWNGGAAAGNKQLDAVGSATIGGDHYVFYSNDSGIFTWDGTSFNLIAGTAGVWAQSSLQYKDFVYFVAQPLSTGNGGKWDGTTYTSIPAMPKGQACVIFKERMWIAPGKHASGTASSRLHFSAIADPASWTTGTDFFDITPGDGSNLVDLVIFNNNLLLFKQNSTFYLSYDSAPAAATVVKISNTIGASNWRCVVENKNDIYVMHETAVYKLVNFSWVQLNVKVPFILDSTVPGGGTRVIHTFICMVGNWLICRYHNNIYVFNTDTETWSNWSAVSARLHHFGPFVQLPSDALFNVIESYYAGSTVESFSNLIGINDGWNAINGEWDGAASYIECSVKTKAYSFNLPYKFKRLWSWGVECVTNKAVTGIATPYAISSPPSVTTVIPATGGSVLKREYRFPKGLRFREIQFEVLLTSDGTTNDGPAQIYTLLAVSEYAQTVPKSVN